MGQAVKSRHPYHEVIAEILALSERGGDWDSYHAEPVDASATLHAIRIVSSFVDLGVPVPTPRVGALPDGSVILMWITDDRKVDVVCREGGGEYVVVRRDTDEIIEERRLNQVDPLKDVVRDHVLGFRPLERTVR